jgi:hypothetical protein
MKEEEEMNRKNTTQTFVIALAIMLALATVPSMAFAQNKADNQSSVSPAGEEGNPLVGVWEELNVPAENDCVTGSPVPGTPIIRALLSFNQGGTMYVEDNAPFDGPYRSTGAGIWKHTSGRKYTYLNLHYAFNPDKTFTFTIKQRSNLTLSQDGNSFTENGTFEVIEPGGAVIYSGCFAATATRLTF